MSSFFMTFFSGPRRRRPRPKPQGRPTPNLFQRWLYQRQQERLKPKPAKPSSSAPSPLVSWWRQFRLRRQQQKSTGRGQWSLAALINPGGLDQLSARSASSLVLRRANVVLVQLTLIALVFNAIPARLSGPEWYLQVISAVAESAPVFVVAFVLGLLSLFISPFDNSALKFHRRLQRSSRVLSLIVVALIPLQIGFTIWLYGQAFSLDRTQLNAIRAQSEALIAGAQTQPGKGEFIAYLRSNNLEANLAAIEAAPLSEAKSAFVQRIQILQKEQEQRLATGTRSTLLRYSTNSLKLFFSLLVFAAFSLGLYSLVRRSMTWLINLSEENTEQNPGQSD